MSDCMIATNATARGLDITGEMLVNLIAAGGLVTLAAVLLAVFATV